MPTKRKVKASQKAFDAAVGGSSVAPEAAPTTVTLSCGVTLRVKPVPGLAIREAVMRIEAPTVPMVHIKDKGRDEENPNDPDYVKALAEYAEAKVLVANDVVLLLGSEIVPPIPEDVIPLDDDGWIPNLSYLGIEFDAENPAARKLAWLKFYVLRTDEDQIRALMGPLRSAGVGEADVARAMESFRNRKERAADNGAGLPNGGDGADNPEPGTGASS
jgi:hypothetical protein